MDDTALSIDETWLSGPSAVDPLRELVPLRRHLKMVCRPGLQRPRDLEARLAACIERVEAVDAAMLLLLTSASLPMPPALRQLVMALDEVHALCADALERAGRAETGGSGAIQQIYHLHRRHLIAIMSFRAPPPDLLPRAIAAYRKSPDSTRANTLFGSLLALAAIRVEGFAPWEIALIAAITERSASSVGVSDAPPVSTDSCYWLTQTGHQRPIAWSRQAPLKRSDLLFFDCSGVAQSINEIVDALQSGAPAVRLGLPPVANQPICIETLRRAVSTWQAPRERRATRHADIRGVQLCCRLGELWRSLNEETGADVDISQWMTLNAGAQGCAVMHLHGDVGGLMAGSALGIRATGEIGWSVCLIRWARSENPAHIELGLELLSPDAKSVRVARADRDAAALLLLPAQPAIGAGEALLSSREQMPQGEFTLIEEDQHRVRFTTCRAGPLRHQSSTTEVREFVRLQMPQ